MKVFVWNVNGVRNTAANIVLRYGSLASFFQLHDADVVCLQETKLSEAGITKDLADVCGYESFWSSSKTKLGYSGVVTFVKLEYAAVYAATDEWLASDADLQDEGRLVLTDLGSCVIVNIYAPNAGERPARLRLPFKLRWYRALRAALSRPSMQRRPVIIVGDFNICPQRRDVSPAIPWDSLFIAEELNALETLISHYSDVWRERHPDTSDVYTVWNEYTNARRINKGQRMDLVLCSPDLLSKASSCEVLLDLPPKWSDHAPCVATFDGLPPHTTPPPPCALSSRADRRFHDASQRSLKSLFQPAAARRPAAAARAAGTPAGATAPTAPGIGSAGAGLHASSAGTSAVNGGGSLAARAATGAAAGGTTAPAAAPGNNDQSAAPMSSAVPLAAVPGGSGQIAAPMSSAVPPAAAPGSSDQSAAPTSSDRPLEEDRRGEEHMSHVASGSASEATRGTGASEAGTARMAHVDGDCGPENLDHAAVGRTAASAAETETERETGTESLPVRSERHSMPGQAASRGLPTKKRKAPNSKRPKAGSEAPKQRQHSIASFMRPAAGCG